MAFRPTQDRIVVRQAEQQEKTASGIVLAGASKDKPLQGEVVAVGPGYTKDNGQFHKPAIEVGNVVIFGSNAGKKITVEGQDLLVMTEAEIFGILD